MINVVATMRYIYVQILSSSAKSGPSNGGKTCRTEEFFFFWFLSGLCKLERSRYQLNHLNIKISN